MSDNQLAEKLEEETRALIDFARYNEHALSQVVESWQASEIIKALSAECMSARDLLVRCQHYQAETNSSRTLIKGLFLEATRKEAWQPMLEALLTMSDDWWERTGFTPKDLYRHTPEVDVLVYLHRKHRQLMVEGRFLKAQTEQLADRYWRRQVVHFIETRDFERAWEEIVRAEHGLLQGDIRQKDFSSPHAFSKACMKPENRCWRASPQVVGQCLQDLYDKMEKQINGTFNFLALGGGGSHPHRSPFWRTESFASDCLMISASIQAHFAWKKQEKEANK